jgi:tRNA nucleotidyltransferase (CCA-adding enzyme)
VIDMTIDPSQPPNDSPREHLRELAPWLFDEQLGACVVGSAALREACRRAGVAGPRSLDVDLAWTVDVDAGERLLRDHRVHLPVTANSRARGTLAMRLGGQRYEITTFRGDGATWREQLGADLAKRDMTIGAIAWCLTTDELIDPQNGIEDWSGQRIEPVGDPAARIAEHPVRWLRYYRRAHELDFALSGRIRKLAFDPSWATAVPREQIAAEFRRALLTTRSPGRWLVELHEGGGLQHYAPELAAQFDGRPAGPVRFHPEVSQALHMVLALEWTVARTGDLTEADRAAVLVAVLCHDLGKGATPREQLPAHVGHERSGVPLVKRLLTSLPGLADRPAQRLAEATCALHLEVRRLRSMRPGTLARLYDDHFRSRDFRADLFALAIGADSGGRLNLEAEGDRTVHEVVANIEAICKACESVDTAKLRESFEDVERFRAELHAARARALRTAGFGSEP